MTGLGSTASGAACRRAPPSASPFATPPGVSLTAPSTRPRSDSPGPTSSIGRRCPRRRSAATPSAGWPRDTTCSSWATSTSPGCGRSRAARCGCSTPGFAVARWSGCGKLIRPMSLRVTMLGSGTSTGVPVIGCTCAVCRSDNPRNKRWRVGLKLEMGPHVVLVDTPTDLRAQALRIGPFAYVTDTSRIPEESFRLLAGVEILILDALRYRPHPTHFSVEEALAAAARVGARRTIFTHLTHDVDHDAPAVPLPPGVELGYD